MNLETLTQPFIDLWASLIGGIALLVPALIVLGLGLLVARILYKAIIKVFNATRVDKFVQPFAGAIERAGYKLSIGGIIAWLVKWFVIIASVAGALDLMNLEFARDLLVNVIRYIPNVIIAIGVLFVGFLLGDFVKKITKGSTQAMNFKSAAMLGNIARIAIIMFALLMSLDLLGLGQYFEILFIGLVAMTSIAGGLAFGLGGRDAAAKAIEDAKHALHK